MRKVQLRLTASTVQFIADNLDARAREDPALPHSERLISLAHYLSWRAAKIADAERGGEFERKQAS